MEHHLSYEAHELLDGLHAKPGLRFWRVLTEPDKRALITSLADLEEVAVLPFLADYGLEAPQPLRAAVANALHWITSRLPLPRWVDLDAGMRRILYFGSETWTQNWNALSSDPAKRLQGHTSAGLLGIVSMHPSGYVREAAVRLLAGIQDGAELPFLLLRLNDWVPSVGAMAQTAVQERVQTGPASALVQVLSLIQRVSGGQRSSHGWLLEAVSQRFGQKEAESALLEGLRSTERVIRKACLQFATAQSNLVSSVLQSALNDPDSMTRLWAAKQLLQRATPEELPALVARLRRDAFMPVRREALMAVLAHNPSAADEMWRKAAFDRHRSIRDLARYQLRGKVDPAQLYREKLESTDSSEAATALLGLGESGTEADASVVTKFLDSPIIRVRKAAVVALGRLAAEAYREKLLAALAGSSPGVSKEAAIALRPIARTLGAELVPVLTQHPNVHVRKRALHLALRVNRWNLYPLLLAAAGDSSEEIRKLVIESLRGVLAGNRDFTQPSKSQAAALHEQLRLSKSHLPSDIVSEMEKLIDDKPPQFGRFALSVPSTPRKSTGD